jgi:hypothetical protein
MGRGPQIASRSSRRKQGPRATRQTRSLDSRFRGNERSVLHSRNSTSAPLIGGHGRSRRGNVFRAPGRPSDRRSRKLEGVKRREARCGAPHLVARLAVGLVPKTEKSRDRRPFTRAGAPFGASPRDFGRRDRSFRGADGGLFTHLIPETFASVRPALVQPTKGRPHVVEADGDPGLPEVWLTRPGSRAPHPTPPNASPVDALEVSGVIGS